MPGSVPGVGNTIVNKTTMTCALMGPTGDVGDEKHMNKYITTMSDIKKKKQNAVQ